MQTTRRRSLLAALGTVAFAGCSSIDAVVDSGDDGATSESTACDVSITAVEDAFYSAQQSASDPFLRADVVLSTGECTDDGVISLVAGDVEIDRTVSFDSSDWNESDDRPGPNRYAFEQEIDALPTGTHLMTVRVADESGEVHAAKTVPLDRPAVPKPDFELHCPVVEPTTTTVDEPVSVTATVSNDGDPDDYVAALDVDGGVVDTREGEASTSPDDVDAECPGETVSFEYPFHESGEHDLRIDLLPKDLTGTGDEVDVGTVTVEADE